LTDLVIYPFVQYDERWAQFMNFGHNVYV
jgi:hypothetical protein